MTVSKRMRTLRQPPPRLTNRWYLLILHFHERACSPAAALGHRLLVGSEVEEDEEEEVRRDSTDSGDSGKFLACAPAGVRKPRPIGACEVGPGGKVDEA